MKKLMIMGAGIYQVPLIKAAREMGIHTIAVSIPGKYPGFSYADEVLHINTTDSAVRITHIPSNIIVTCQSERSQHKNKATALRILKAKLYEKIEMDKKAEQNKEYGEKQDIGWGSQIRSYVFQPYQMVKDHRTNVEAGDVNKVLDGELDQFIKAYLYRGE